MIQPAFATITSIFETVLVPLLPKMRPPLTEVKDVDDKPASSAPEIPKIAVASTVQLLLLG